MFPAMVFWCAFFSMEKSNWSMIALFLVECNMSNNFWPFWNDSMILTNNLSTNLAYGNDSSNGCFLTIAGKMSKIGLFKNSWKNMNWIKKNSPEIEAFYIAETYSSVRLCFIWKVVHSNVHSASRQQKKQSEIRPGPMFFPENSKSATP